MNYQFTFDVNQLRLILAGLDELPGKMSRQMYNSLVQDAQQQEAVENGRKAEAKRQAEEAEKKKTESKAKAVARKKPAKKPAPKTVHSLSQPKAEPQPFKPDNEVKPELARA